MPRYDYRCSSCGVTYERKESFEAPLQHACENCGGVSRRVFVAPPILFKGSGFYVTDSKNGSSAATGTSGAKEGTEEKPAATGDSGSETKTESPAKAETAGAAKAD